MAAASKCTTLQPITQGLQVGRWVGR